MTLAPLAPVVGLARNVTLNGQPAPAGALTPGVGLTPTVSFEPPAFGTPTSSRVRVNKIRTDRSDPDREPSPSGSPFRRGPHLASSTTFTGVFTP